MSSGHLIKRSVTVKGHRTSVALESEFWAALEALAKVRSITMTQLILQADLNRKGALTSTLRVMSLKAARNGEIPALQLASA